MGSTEGGRLRLLAGERTGGNGPRRKTQAAAQGPYPSDTHSGASPVLGGEAELVTRHIGPELERGSIVIADRYVHSTIAYQGYGYEGRKGGPTQKQIQAVNLIATKDVMPDLTILLDMEPDEALKRIAALAPELSIGENAGQGAGWTKRAESSRMRTSRSQEGPGRVFEAG